MTGTNHVLTGALVAVAVRQPALAIPVAFLSHFVIDALPHYGYGHISADQRDMQHNFMAKQLIDGYAALALYLFLPSLLASRQAPLVTAICMLMAQAPDTYWAYEYMRAQRQGSYKSRNWYARFHKAIQWCEPPWGIYVEAIWFIGISTAIWVVIK